MSNCLSWSSSVVNIADDSSGSCYKNIHEDSMRVEEKISTSKETVLLKIE